MGLHARRGPGALSREREKRSRPVRVLLGRMVGYLGRFKRIVVIGVVLSLLATIVTMFDPIILQNGIDLVFLGGGTFNALLFLVVLYAAIKIAAWIMSSINVWILSGAQAGLVRAVQSDVYDHLVNADLAYHKSEQSGDVTSRVTSDTDSLGIGIQVLIDFASQALMIVSTFILLWIVSPTIALTALIVVPAILLIAVLFGTVGQKVMLASQRAYGRVSGQIAENLSGIHIAKSFNREEELAEEMLKLNEEAYKYGFKFMIMMSALHPLMRSVGQLAVAAMLFVGGTLAVGTLPVLTFGQVFLGVILVNRFMWPLLALAMMSTQVQASLAAMDRISDVLEAKPSIADIPESISLLENSDGITFDNVTFSYVEDTPVLKSINFKVSPGETVAIVGHTGAGKTTIASLINRFYDPQQGRILIGDQDLKDITLESLHDAVSLIPQEPYLFDGTIMENIRYGRPEAADEDIIDLCTLIGANEFIEVLADGYETLIIEDGKNLSAGQKQMITIARTMLANPRILILDEATSRLDAYSESLVQDAQAKLFSNRTTVVIAHRLTTIANASRIIVFDHGEIVEEGTHEELLALGGLFKTVYDTYYAHQGVEELTEEMAAAAGAEISKCAEEGPLPAVAHGAQQAMMMRMADGQPSFRGHSTMIDQIPSELLEQINNDPDSIPPEIRKKLRKMMKPEK